MPEALLRLDLLLYGFPVEKFGDMIGQENF